MRNCPVCQTSNRDLIMPHYDNSEWTMYCCKDCRIFYLDSDNATEQNINDFYNNVYQTDDAPYSDKRLYDLSQFIEFVCSDRKAPIMDIGGKDQVLANKIRNLGFINVDVSGPGDELPKVYQIIILSHTFEHVYDLSTMIAKIKSHLDQSGFLIIEVPIWSNDSSLRYDYHFQHINKFTPEHLETIFKKNGFKIIVSTPIPPYREYNCYRLAVQLI